MDVVTFTVYAWIAGGIPLLIFLSFVGWVFFDIYRSEKRRARQIT
jgi:uncharacterized protein (TIGR02588 family)